MKKQLFAFTLFASLVSTTTLANSGTRTDTDPHPAHKTHSSHSFSSASARTNPHTTHSATTSVRGDKRGTTTPDAGRNPDREGGEVHEPNFEDNTGNGDANE